MSTAVSAVARQLHAASVVGVSGSRAATPGSVRAVTWAVGQLGPRASVVVDAGAAVGRAARGVVPGAEAFEAGDFGFGVSAEARCAAAVVERVGSAERVRPGSTLWLSAPDRPCPPGLSPSTSPRPVDGPWGPLALALGLGVRALVWPPSDDPDGAPGDAVVPPAGWGLTSVCPGKSGTWWGSTSAPQAQLF